MMAQRIKVLPHFSLFLSDCESHGHLISLPVFSHNASFAMLQRLPMGFPFVPNTCSPRFPKLSASSSWLCTSSGTPENCTKPIKEDTVAVHAA